MCVCVCCVCDLNCLETSTESTLSDGKVCISDIVRFVSFKKPVTRATENLGGMVEEAAVTTEAYTENTVVKVVDKISVSLYCAGKCSSAVRMYINRFPLLFDCDILSILMKLGEKYLRSERNILGLLFHCFSRDKYTRQSIRPTFLLVQSDLSLFLRSGLINQGLCAQLSL